MNDQPKIKVYCAHGMTGRFMDELVFEAELTTRVLENFGFEVYDPIIMEKIPTVHEILTQISEDQLKQRWADDKAAIRDADIVLDYMSMNKSDGVNVEVGMTRFGLWKPVVRVWPGMKISISKLEYDYIAPSLFDAVVMMIEKFGTYEKLGKWRKEMLDRCFGPWLHQQHILNARYNIHGGINLIQ